MKKRKTWTLRNVPKNITPEQLSQFYADGVRPSTWVYPYDQESRLKHRAYSRAKSQAVFRGEGWEITPKEWMEQIWPAHLWDRRGRASTDLCMNRIDPDEPWHLLNVRIVTRRTQLTFQKYDPTIAEVEPGVWDLVGDSLQRWEDNQAFIQKYQPGRKRKK